MILCITEAWPSAGEREKCEREIISDETKAVRATPALVERLRETATEEYQKMVLRWWQFNREKVFKIQNGNSFDYWIWCD